MAGIESLALEPALIPNLPEIIEGEVGAHELNLTKLGLREIKE